MEEFPDTPTITAVEPRDGFRVWVSFSDGVSGEFDAAEHVEWTVSEDHDVRQSPPPRWQDRKFFESLRPDEDGWSLRWGHSDGLGNDIWIDDYRAYAGVVGRPSEEVKVEWWGEDAEPIRYPQATHVETRDGFRVFLEYDDGVSGELDLSHLANTQIFGFWREPGRFGEVKLDRRANEITWGKDRELCAWHLYEKMTGVNLHGFSAQHLETSAAD